jgi:hypothetical protein
LKTKSRIEKEKEKEIIASVKREMEKPRLAASVRVALETEAALTARSPVVHLARARGDQ